MISKIRPILSIFLLATLSLQPALAQEKANEIDWKVGAWGDLSQYIGTYQYDAVLKDKRVAAALEALLGKETRNGLDARLFVQAPIGFTDDCLLLSGSAQGGDNETFIAVCLYKGVVHAALETGNMIMLYTKAEKYEYLPGPLQMWVYLQKNPDAATLPDGVDFMLVP